MPRVQFDTFASHEKTLQANMGGHTGVPRYAVGGRDTVLHAASTRVNRRWRPDVAACAMRDANPSWDPFASLNGVG